MCRILSPLGAGFVKLALAITVVFALNFKQDKRI